MAIKRAFKGVWIPREIYLATGFSWTEKLLLCEIDSLDADENRGCYASNEYLAAFLGNDTKPHTVANIIWRLKKIGALIDIMPASQERGLRSTVHAAIKDKENLPVKKSPEHSAAKTCGECEDSSGFVEVVVNGVPRFKRCDHGKSDNKT